MKAFAIVAKTEIVLIQDELLIEYGSGCCFAIYEDLDTAKAASDFYSIKDKGDIGLQHPYSIVEVEITLGKKLFTSDQVWGKDEEAEAV